MAEHGRHSRSGARSAPHEGGGYGLVASGCQRTVYLTQGTTDRGHFRDRLVPHGPCSVARLAQRKTCEFWSLTGDAEDSQLVSDMPTTSPEPEQGTAYGRRLAPHLGESGLCQDRNT